MKKHFIALSFSLLTIFGAEEFTHAQAEIVASLDWRHAPLPESTVLRHDDDEGPVLEVNINHRNIISLWSLDRPQVDNEAHAIKGRIRVQSAAGNAQFEMWTCFGDDGDWYSRMPVNLSPSINDSEWLAFEIPFDLGGEYTLGFPPNKMLLTLELPDGGLLWLSNLDLLQYIN